MHCDGRDTVKLSPKLELAGVSLRDMTEADVPAVETLERRLFPPVDAWPLQMFFDELAQPETRRYVVAEVAGEIVLTPD